MRWAFIILIGFGFFSSLRSEETVAVPMDSVFFPGYVSIEKSVKKFNARFADFLHKHGSVPLTSEEVRNSLDIGSTFIMHPDQTAVSGLCASGLAHDRLPKGSCFLIYSWELPRVARSVKSEPKRKFIFIMLLVNPNRQPSPSRLQPGGTIPVRLVPSK